jgi:hypothetical protein
VDDIFLCPTGFVAGLLFAALVILILVFLFASVEIGFSPGVACLPLGFTVFRRDFTIGGFTTAGVNTMAFCSAFSTADFFVGPGFDAMRLETLAFTLFVFGDTGFASLDFDGDFLDGDFLIKVFASSAVEAGSNPKVNCSASALRDDSLACSSSPPHFIPAPRAAPLPERGISDGMVNPTTWTFLASTTVFPDATRVCKGASSRRMALGASLVKCKVTRVEGLPTANPTNVAVRGSFQATTP